MHRHRIVMTSLVIATALLSADLAVAATCTLPQTIANGQVADASKVMDNFNAVADCAEAAVTPSGSPGTGAVAVFSGPSSITSGDLSGDVTTAGGTATTLSSTGVVAGSYTGADITVDAKGRIVAASNGAGGVAANNLVATRVADGTSNSVTISGIPQGYRDLVLVINGQSVNAAQDLAMYANGDTLLSNYKNFTWNRFGNGTVTVPRIGTFPGLNIPSVGSAATIYTQIIGYSGTTWKKNALSENQYMDNTNFFRSMLEWRWNNTNAITSLTFTVASGNIADGTTFQLYVR